MAERLIRQLVDDLDGTEIAYGKGERIDLTFRGVDYQLDLSAANVMKLEHALLPFLEAATKRLGTSSHRARYVAGTLTGEHAARIREWARHHGYEVAARGRIRADVIEAFIVARGT